MKNFSIKATEFVLKKSLGYHYQGNTKYTFIYLYSKLVDKVERFVIDNLNYKHSPWYYSKAEQIKKDWNIIHKTYRQEYKKGKPFLFYFSRSIKDHNKLAREIQKRKASKYKGNGDYVYNVELLPKFEKNNTDYIIQENPFPYQFYHLKHYNFWFKKGSENKYDLDFAYQQTKKLFPTSKTIEVYENPLEKRSIPEVKHYQIFIEI